MRPTAQIILLLKAETPTCRAGERGTQTEPCSRESSDTTRTSSPPVFQTNMRLLDTETQELKFFPERGRPRYAILSHTWEDDEILFFDIVRQDQDWRWKAGAGKVLGSCQVARNQGYKFIWIDTCCIDKSSSAELSEGESHLLEALGR